MVILDTAVIPLINTPYTVREFYQDQPRSVQVTIVGTAKVTLYGRVDARHPYLPIASFTASDLLAVFLPKQIYAVPSEVAGSWSVIVSVNITQ